MEIRLCVRLGMELAHHIESEENKLDFHGITLGFMKTTVQGDLN